MKKCLSIIILTVFVLSIAGSVSPEVKSYVISWTGGEKYASSILPAPPPMKMNKNLAKN